MCVLPRRKGAAFGLAGVVKGLSLMSLKGYGIMDALKAGVENKGDVTAREGSLLAFECLSERLGRLFEPYVITILPMLLVCFGDPSQAVRDATDGAARTIMGQLSGQGGVHGVDRSRSACVMQCRLIWLPPLSNMEFVRGTNCGSCS